MRELVAGAFAADGLEFKPVFQTLHMMSLIAMIKAGFGVGFLPRRILPMLSMDAIGVARIGRSGIFREVCLATDRGRALQPPAEALMMTFREVL